MDDLIISGDDQVEIDNLKKHLHQEFHIKDLEKLKYFLGIEVSQSDIGIFISQRKYAFDILHDFGQLGTSPSKISMPHNSKDSDTDIPLKDLSSYKILIGKLLFTITRPDIAFAVNHYNQFLSNPLKFHFNSAIKILKYIKWAPGKGILYRRDAPFQLQTYYDVDWADCPNTRKSITGYSILLGGSTISWKSKK